MWRNSEATVAPQSLKRIVAPPDSCRRKTRHPFDALAGGEVDRRPVTKIRSEEGRSLHWATINPEPNDQICNELLVLPLEHCIP